MRAAIGLRLLLALTLMGWGQFVFAVDYYWVSSGSSFSDAHSACVHGFVVRNLNLNDPQRATLYTDSNAYCQSQLSNGSWATYFEVTRLGDSCPPDSIYNSVTGECEVPKDCSSTAGNEIRKAQTCTYDLALKLVVCDSEISYEGCLYTKGGKSDCVSDIATGNYICTSSFYGSGGVAGSGPDTCSGESCSPVASDNPGPNCVSSNGIELCSDHQDPGCGTINGVYGCYQEPPGCGYFNGTYQCIGADKPNRNCGYFNGVQTCFDPNDPTKAIPPTSSDHPSNGGNADGDDTNDPLPSGSTDSSAQGSNEGATNEALQGLGDKLGDKLDDGNSLLGDIANGIKELGEALGEFMDGVLGEEYDGSGSGEGEGIGDDAGEASQGLANSFGEALEGTLIDQAVADESALDGFSDLISDPQIGWFGENSSAYYLVNLIDGVLPRPTGCVPYTVRVQLNRYSFDVKIDPCILQFLQKLLEWIIWMLTIIGVWRIAYSTLRLENAKADKGGF